MDQDNNVFWNYFRNLWRTASGRNPFKEDLDKLQRQCNSTEEDMLSLKKLYCASIDNLDKEIELRRSLQTLVENLRQRLAEKDTILKQTKKSYQDRILAYNEEIDKLRSNQKKRTKKIKKSE